MPYLETIYNEYEGDERYCRKMIDLPEELLHRIGESDVGFAAKLMLTNKRNREHFQPQVDRAKERMQEILHTWKAVLRFSRITQQLRETGGHVAIKNLQDLRIVYASAQNEDKQEIILDVILSLALAPSACLMSGAMFYHEVVNQAYHAVGQIGVDCSLLHGPLPAVYTWSCIEQWFWFDGYRTTFLSWGLDHLPKRTEYLNDLMDPEDEDSVHEATVFLDGVFDDIMTVIETLPNNVRLWILTVVSYYL